MKNNIKTIREQKGISRKKLSEQSGLHYNKLKDYENEYIKIENITVGNLNKLAKALNVTLDELCRDDEAENN